MLWTKNVEGQEFANAIVFHAATIGAGCKSSMSTRHQSLKCDIQRPCYNLDLWSTERFLSLWTSRVISEGIRMFFFQNLDSDRDVIASSFFSDRDGLYAGGMKGGYNPLVANLKPKRIAPHFPGLGHEQSIRCGFAFCSPRCTVVLAPSRLLWVWKMHRVMRESVLLHSSKNRNTLYKCVYRKYKRPRLTYHIKNGVQIIK